MINYYILFFFVLFQYDRCPAYSPQIIPTGGIAYKRIVIFQDKKLSLKTKWEEFEI